MSEHRLHKTRPVGLEGRRVAPRGAVLIVAIVCMAVATVIFASLLRLAVAERRAVRAEAWRVQASWLAESAIERAAYRLAADADYAGETWQIPADALGGEDDAVVKIEVRPVAERPNRRVVWVRADYPDDPQQRARNEKQTVVHVRPAVERPAAATSEGDEP